MCETAELLTHTDSHYKPVGVQFSVEKCNNSNNKVYVEVFYSILILLGILFKPLQMDRPFQYSTSELLYCLVIVCIVIKTEYLNLHMASNWSVRVFQRSLSLLAAKLVPPRQLC